jgi:hypothetical protein
MTKIRCSKDSEGIRWQEDKGVLTPWRACPKMGQGGESNVPGCRLWLQNVESM